MDMFDFIMGAVSFFGAIGLVLGLALLVHWGRDREVGLMPYFFYPSLLFAGLFILTSNRDVSVPIEFLRTVAPEVKNPAVALLGRMTSIFILMAIAERVLHRIFSKLPQPEFPRLLFFGLTVYFLTNVVSPGLFGAHPDLIHENFYAYLTFCAGIILNAKEATIAFKSARNGFIIFLLIGLICMFVKPTLVLNTNYNGLIPFLKIRLAGLAVHPNGLGVIAVIVMLTLWRYPFSSRILSFIGWFVAITSFILAQSKTCWIAFFFCAASIYYFSYGHVLKQYFLNYRRAHLNVLLIGMVMLAGLSAGIAFMFFGVGEHITSFLNSRTGTELASFSGRDIIWQIAIEEWHRNPIFGYGLSIWDDDFRKSVQLANATSAHSQFYQSLSCAGIVGATGLIIYCTTLFYLALKTAKSSRGLSLAMFILIFSGCLSEVPLVMDSFGASPIIAHILLLIVIATSYQPKPEPVSQRVQAMMRMEGAT